MFAFQISILDAYVRSLHCHVMVQALGLVYCGKYLKQLHACEPYTAPWSFLGCQLCRNCPCRKAGTPSAVCPWVERIWILGMQYFPDQTDLGTELNEWHCKFWRSTHIPVQSQCRLFEEEKSHTLELRLWYNEQPSGTHRSQGSHYHPSQCNA